MVNPEETKSDAATALYSLHAVDISSTDETSLQEQLIKQMESVGFLLLRNIPGYDEKELLSACEKLHNLPPSEKQKMYKQKDFPQNPNTYRGYQGFQPNDKSHKEFLDMGMPMESLVESEKTYPLYEETPLPANKEICAVLDKNYKLWYNVALKVTRLIAQGLGKPKDFFDPWFVNGSLTTFRSIHYLPRKSDLVDSSQLSDDERKLTTPEHADSGFMTFLATYGYPGLQVLIDGEYRDIQPMSNTLVVNLGDTFARMTNYRLKATFHRVLDIGRERFSSPMFLEPKYSARMPKVSTDILGEQYNSVDDVKEDNDETFLFGDWLIKRMCHAYVEWANYQFPPERKDFIEKISINDFVN